MVYAVLLGGLLGREPLKLCVAVPGLKDVNSLTITAEERHFSWPPCMSTVEPGNPQTEGLKESESQRSDSNAASHSRVRFGLYEVNLPGRELRKAGQRLKLPYQSFRILAMLLEKPGQLVSRENLRRELWPDDVYVNFEGSLNSAVQRLRSALQDTSREPRYIETLPREGYRFIASVEVLAPSSTETPETPAMSGPVEPSVDLASSELDNTVSAPDHNLRHWVGVGLFSIAVLVIAFVGYLYTRPHQRLSDVQSPPAQPALPIPSSLTRRSVAIMGFTNAAGDPRNLWLSTAFTEMLATELAAGDQLRTVAGEHVARAKLELSLGNEDSYAGDTLARIHKDLGCDYVVAGSYLAIGQAGNGKLRLDARVQNAITGDTVASVAVVGSRADLFDLASRAGEQLRAKLGIGTLSSTESAEVRLALPSDPEAARLYSEGLTKLRFYDDVVASDLFEKVILLQPEYAPAYSALASASFALGYDAKAAVAARKAMDLSGNLPEQARLQTEARYHKINGDWAQAVEIYSRLQRSYPDNLDYGLDLALAQNSMGKSAEAAATIAALRKLPTTDAGDPGLDLAEAGIAGELADYKRELSLAESAARKSEAAGERLLLARAKMIVGYATTSLGDFSSSIEAYAVAQRLCAESGDLVGAALATMDTGIALANQGDLAGSKRNVEQALVVFREKGDQASLAAALTNLSEIYGSEGDLPKQEHLLRETLVISNKLNRIGKRDIELSNLARVLQREGKFREAKEMLEPLMQHFRDAQEKPLLAASLDTLGSIAETQGDMPTAVRLYQEGAELFRDTGNKAEYAAAERRLARAFLRGRDFTKAKQALSESLSVDRDIGAKADGDLSQVELADAATAQAEPVDMGAVRAAIDELRSQKMTDDEIEGEIVLARAFIQQNEASEAASALKDAAVLSSKSYDPTVRFDVELVTAHLRAAQHRFDEARRTAQPALQKAVAIGCVRCQLEARLELGEIEMQAGNAERGRNQLHQLAGEAQGRGFNLIAEQAAAYAR
jgi:DNA-binding winged helix-turn-helix (wHTH) protein/tetratricopeptide (TPR) repeat protein